MRKLIAFWLFIPFIGLGRTKNVLSNFRVFPKTDKVVEFEKALMTHAQKFHAGDWKWRVFEVQSGPDAGAYSVSEGPNSWEQLDGRGNISPEHGLDWDKNVMPLTTGGGTASYGEYNAELSTAELTDFTDKVSINHVYAKPGKFGEVIALIRKLKKVWQQSNQSVAVYQSIASGTPGFLVVTRLKGGLKELATGYRKPLPERYDAANGEGSFELYTQKFEASVERRWDELLTFRADLSSK